MLIDYRAPVKLPPRDKGSRRCNLPAKSENPPSCNPLLEFNWNAADTSPAARARNVRTRSRKVCGICWRQNLIENKNLGRFLRFWDFSGGIVMVEAAYWYRNFKNIVCVLFYNNKLKLKIRIETIVASSFKHHYFVESCIVILNLKSRYWTVSLKLNCKKSQKNVWPLF